ncbi:tetratricopeptide repeat protein [Pseudanabaena sp. UWO311]|uniref:tetratricopeptide repeat protein n=1 Tax=Pseudanabaena sp. UWO311 TaxID=2487337 RepID=UPI001157CB3A|nr:tetratricopeptide repeat protein [Pseudanabaena sp. UWO311]TYQ28653.1 tetratricopeptide repeat protein [Pseudanabaena sp. UWO311]
MANLTAGKRLFTALEIDLDTVPIEYLDDYIAIEYFLTSEDEPPADASNLEKIDPYLQVFNHLREASAWQQAGQVLSFRLEDNDRELHEKLRLWGYYRDQIELYQSLLGKVNSEQDLVCLSGLGWAFYYLSDSAKSLDYFQQQLDLARQINNRQAEAQALNGLGALKLLQFKHLEAIACYQQQLEITLEIDDQLQEGYANQYLGFTFVDLGFTNGSNSNRQTGLQYLEKSLNIAQKFGDHELECLSLNSIAYICTQRGQHERSAEYLEQTLDVCSNSSDQHGRYVALQNLGLCYMMLKNHDKALECIQEALEIAREIGDRIAEGKALASIGSFYYLVAKQYQNAIFYFEKALNILRKLDVKQDIVICAINLSICHTYIKQTKESNLCLEIAESIAKELDCIETKGIVTMALANAYWNRDRIWDKLFGLFLAAKGLMMIPPWRSANGRLALQETTSILTKSAQDLLMKAFKNMRNLFNLETVKEFIANDRG